MRGDCAARHHRTPRRVLLALLALCGCCSAAADGWRAALDLWRGSRATAAGAEGARARGTASRRRGAEAEADGGGRLPVLPGGYLYPILAWGPNNQVAGLKEALVLGRLLGRTVIVHDILNHYDDQGGGSGGAEDAHGPRSMEFGLLFDLPYLAARRSVVSLAEARAAGWDGVLGAVAHFGPKFLPQVKTAHALNVSDAGAEYVDFREFECTDEQVSSMVSRLSGHTHVGAIVYENVVRDAGHGLKLRVTGERCHDEYLLVSGQLIKSGPLVALAAAFRERHLGGGAAPFLAVHIRPYPDTCLYVWRKPEYNQQLAARKCKNRNLHAVFVPQTQRALKQRRLARVFVMTYPSLRERVTALYGEAGIEPVFYDEADLVAAVGYSSLSLLGMVEEEVAFEADAFIGTSYSSMSSIIMQERYARGKPKDSTLIFTKTS